MNRHNYDKNYLFMYKLCRTWSKLTVSRNYKNCTSCEPSHSRTHTLGFFNSIRTGPPDMTTLNYFGADIGIGNWCGTGRPPGRFARPNCRGLRICPAWTCRTTTSKANCNGSQLGLSTFDQPWKLFPFSLINFYLITWIWHYLTASNASVMASSDQGVGFDLDNSIPSRLHLPYKVPDGIPNSVDAFCTEVVPDRIASKAFSKSSCDQVVGAALNGAAKRMPSRLAILYKVLLGMPKQNGCWNWRNAAKQKRAYRMFYWLCSLISFLFVRPLKLSVDFRPTRTSTVRLSLGCLCLIYALFATASSRGFRNKQTPGMLKNPSWT